MVVRILKAIVVIGVITLPAFMAPLEAKDAHHEAEQQRSVVPSALY